MDDEILDIDCRFPPRPLNREFIELLDEAQKSIGFHPAPLEVYETGREVEIWARLGPSDCHDISRDQFLSWIDE